MSSDPRPPHTGDAVVDAALESLRPHALPTSTGARDLVAATAALERAREALQSRLADAG